VLGDVSCATASSCIAVGQTGPATNTKSKPFAVRWDGTRWSALSISAPSEYAGLGPVECPKANLCFAVSGYSQGNAGKTALVRWNGSAWSIVRPARPSSGFVDMSCAGPTSCMLVSSSVTERWNGKNWTTSPFLPNTTVEGVACPAASACFAVGSNSQGTASARWNATRWIAGPPPVGASRAHFDQIACASPTQCLAIGTFHDGTGRRSLAEQWNGTKWTYGRGPQLPTGASSVTWLDLGCPSATECLAVGAYRSGGSGHPLVQRWNGSSWSTPAIETPPGAVSYGLSGLDCPSSSSCYAVGWSWTGSALRTLVEHWNGTAWSIVAGSPLAGELKGVSCTSGTNCVAVGIGAGGTLAVHWNGTAWTVVPSPNPPEGGGDLKTVSCTSPTHCVAVGSYSEPFGQSGYLSRPFAEAWDGTDWSLIASPSPPLSHAIPSAISCANDTQCFVVGGGFNFDDAEPLFAQQWNGSGWTDIALPRPANTWFRTLADVSCTGATCMIAGSYTTPNSEYTFVARYA
jgi:hypothetical protein